MSVLGTTTASSLMPIILKCRQYFARTLHFGQRPRRRLPAEHFAPQSHFYGILSYDLTPQTQWRVGTELHRFRNKGSSRFSYLTVAGNRNDGFKPFESSPRNNSSARWAYGKDNSAEVFTSLSHEFANGWKLTGDYSYLTGKSDIVSGIAGTFESIPTTLRFSLQTATAANTAIKISP